MNDPRTKVMTLEQAVEARLKLAAAGRKLAVTNGCFDLLHRGHAEYLMQARALADRLFFLINSDGIIIRISASEVSKMGRTTQGVRIMKIDEGIEIVAMARAIREDDEELEELPSEGSADSEAQVELKV